MRILNVKQGGVTRGVLDKGVQLLEHLTEVTFEDYLGTPHTVFAHSNGPFQTAEEIADAWLDHSLHDAENDPAQVTPTATPAGIAQPAGAAVEPVAGAEPAAPAPGAGS